MDRREFLKGLLASTALVALPLPASKLGYKYFHTVAVGYRVPSVGFEIGRIIGDQLLPEAPLNQTGPRLKKLKDGTLWTREEERPEEGLHP